MLNVELSAIHLYVFVLMDSRVILSSNAFKNQYKRTLLQVHVHLHRAEQMLSAKKGIMRDHAPASTDTLEIHTKVADQSA